MAASAAKRRRLGGGHLKRLSLPRGLKTVNPRLLAATVPFGQLRPWLCQLRALECALQQRLRARGCSDGQRRDFEMHPAHSSRGGHDAYPISACIDVNSACFAFADLDSLVAAQAACWAWHRCARAEDFWQTRLREAWPASACLSEAGLASASSAALYARHQRLRQLSLRDRLEPVPDRRSALGACGLDGYKLLIDLGCGDTTLLQGLLSLRQEAEQVAADVPSPTAPRCFEVSSFLRLSASLLRVGDGRLLPLFSGHATCEDLDFSVVIPHHGVQRTGGLRSSRQPLALGLGFSFVHYLYLDDVTWTPGNLSEVTSFGSLRLVWEHKAADRILSVPETIALWEQLGNWV